MKHYILYTAALTALAIPAMAQETYESANIATEDLNGTARYVGMGGVLTKSVLSMPTRHPEATS